MSRSVRLLTLLAAGLLVATSAMAFQNPLSEQIDRQSNQTGGIKKLARTLGSYDGIPPVPLPMPIEPGLRTTVAQSAKGDVDLGSGGALVGAHGGPMATPKQQADMQIRKLIRNLY